MATTPETANASPARRSAGGPWLLAVAAVCLIPRVALWFAYEPIVQPDTKDYFSLAHTLSSWQFSDIDGQRTPVYPLLLLLGACNHSVVWLLQMLLGVATALLLFDLIMRETGSRTAALIAGLSCGLSLNLIFFEACLLTETLATFLLVLAALLYGRIRADPLAGALAYAGLGTVLALAGLTRPLLLIAIPPGVLFLLLPWGRPMPRRLWIMRCFSFPVIVSVFGWCAVVWNATGSFTPTTLLGYNLSQHSGGFIELAPAEDAQLRDIYLRERAGRIAETGTHTGTIWWADKEMRQATGLSPNALSARLTHLSIALFMAHPSLYLDSVRRSWLAFWEPRIVWQLESFHYPLMLPVLHAAWRAQTVLLSLLKIVLLPVALLWFLAHAARRPQRQAAELPLFLLAVIGSASVLQALVEFGANARYAIPFQPLMIAVVVLCGWQAVRSFGRSVQRKAPGGSAAST